jgi:hypothetical protein
MASLPSTTGYYPSSPVKIKDKKGKKVDSGAPSLAGFDQLRAGEHPRESVSGA